jgi:hypothetical protein
MTPRPRDLRRPLALATALCLLAAAGDAAAQPIPLTPAERTITISATGDITLGKRGTYPPGGAARLLREVRRFLHGGLVLGNLETVLGGTGPSKCGEGAANCYSFTAPEGDAAGLKRAGYTVLNLANNHANDYGTPGQARTIAALRRARLRWTGKPGQIAYVPVDGVRVALVGFAPYPWAQDLVDVAAARRIVRRAARQAQLVVVTMHAGGEGTDYRHVRPGSETYLGENRGDPWRFAHAVIDAGADIVIGHGPHVLRGLEWYRGRLIAYSLGNLSGYHTLGVSGITGVSAVLHATLRADGRFVSGSVVPLRLVGAGTPVYDSSHAAWPIVRALSRDDFGASAARLDPRGHIRPR